MSDVQRWEDGLTEMQRRNAARAPERNAHYDRVAEEALEMFLLSGKVLDLGCGSGWARRRLQGVEYIGIDPCCSGHESGMIRGTAESLPFSDSWFDGVLCYSVLQHVLDPERTLTEAARVLKPYGRVGLLVCVESQDPCFMHHWSIREAVDLAAKNFRIAEHRIIAGLYPADGFHLLILGFNVK